LNSFKRAAVTAAFLFMQLTISGTCRTWRKCSRGHSDIFYL